MHEWLTKPLSMSAATGAPTWAGNFGATVVDADNHSVEGRGLTRELGP